MTVITQWLDLRACYKASRPNMLKPLLVTGGLRQTWPAWGLLSAGFALILAHSLQPDSALGALATSVGVALFILGLLLTKERAQAWDFHDHYQRYSLGKLSFFKREEYLRYVIFLETLITQGKTSADIKNLIKIAETAREPEKPSLASQSLLIVTLLSALVTVSANLLIDTETWEANRGFIFLLPILLGLYITWAVVDIARSTRHRDLMIVRALERAQIDIELMGQGRNAPQEIYTQITRRSRG